MGTEELTIEEGHTEPPICGFNDENKKKLAPVAPPPIYGVSTLELDASDKDTVCTNATLSADDFHADCTHVFPVAQVCGCLNTDVKFVAPFLFLLPLKALYQMRLLD